MARAHSSRIRSSIRRAGIGEHSDGGASQKMPFPLLALDTLHPVGKLLAALAVPKSVRKRVGRPRQTIRPSRVIHWLPARPAANAPPIRYSLSPSCTLG